MDRAFGLTVEGLAVGWQQSTLISGIDLQLEPGASLGIVGESGCGKSTLLQVLAGLHAPMAGSVKWGPARRRPKMAMVWQNLALLPWKSVFENMALPLRIENAPDIEKRVGDMMRELELTGLEKRWPHELSGGQRQRLAIGRALIGEPDILFLDEPFSAIDAILRERMQNLLRQLKARHNFTMVFVTHDINEAALLGSDILMLAASPSRVVACGKNPAYSADPACDVRSDENFYKVAANLHGALVSVRCGREVVLENGSW